MLHSTKLKVRLVVICLVHRAVQRGSTCKRVQIRENNTSLHFAKAVSGFLKKSVETFWFAPKKNDMKRYETIPNDMKRYETIWTIWNDMEKGAKKNDMENLWKTAAPVFKNDMKRNKTSPIFSNTTLENDMETPSILREFSSFTVPKRQDRKITLMWYSGIPSHSALGGLREALDRNSRVQIMLDDYYRWIS